MVLFLGSRSKDIALTSLYKLQGGRRLIGTGQNSIHIDPATMGTDCPIFIAQSTPLAPEFALAKQNACHETSSHTVRWTSNKQELWLAVHCRYLFLFSDVICLFANDFGGVQETVKMLCKLASFGSASSAPQQLRPRVLIVSSREQTSATAQVLETEECRYRILQETGHEIYSQIVLVQLPGDHCSPRTRHKILKESIHKHTTQMQHIRRTTSYLFTANHLSAFMSLAMAHTSRTSDQPFDFVSQSRKLDPVAFSFPEHLARFLRLTARLKVPHDVLAAYIASTILMDAYPMNMHSKSDCKVCVMPTDLFRRIQSEGCIRHPVQVRLSESNQLAVLFKRSDSFGLALFSY